MSTLPDIPGMQRLKNPKHEAFARKVATGMVPTEAYKKIFGGKLTSAKGSACRLLTDANVINRRNFLQSQAETKAHLTIKEKRDLFALIVRTPIGDVNETSILCQSFKRTFTETGSTTEFKMIDKLAAIKMDNELSGHVVQAAAQINIQNNHTVNLIAMTEPRRRELMDKKRAAIEKRLALPLKSANPTTIET